MTEKTLLGFPVVLTNENDVEYPILFGDLKDVVLSAKYKIKKYHEDNGNKIITELEFISASYEIKNHD